MIQKNRDMEVRQRGLKRSKAGEADRARMPVPWDLLRAANA